MLHQGCSQYYSISSGPVITSIIQPLHVNWAGEGGGGGGGGGEGEGVSLLLAKYEYRIWKGGGGDICM